MLIFVTRATAAQFDPLEVVLLTPIYDFITSFRGIVHRRTERMSVVELSSKIKFIDFCYKFERRR